MTEKMDEDFWDDLFGEKILPLQPMEVTRIMVARERGLNYKTAVERIEELVKAGKLESVGKRRVESGHLVEA